MKPDVGLVQIVFPPLMEPILRGQFEMLLAKSRPADQMRLVDLECAIEPGIEDCRQRDHTLGKCRFLVEEGQADPNDDLGRTKIGATRGDSNLLIAEE
jgi:hypothetical protein